ncbi:MAG TPA: fatty acid desaturase [Pyrinomonadaceae bacterium]|nr:fatty acid desaturase [Pyrinomonadaceae bacterium]
MRIYNVIGYSLILVHSLASGFAAPDEWEFLGGTMFGIGYLIFIWLISGLFLSNVLHMGIAHKSLDFKPWFLKSVIVVYSLTAIYVNPKTWVNRHRHHHAFSDREGDPSKLHEDGFWQTLYHCFWPYEVKNNLAKDPIFKSWTLRIVSNWYFFAFSQITSFGLLWLLSGDLGYSLVLWLSVRLFGLWINMIQNYWTHDRRFGTRRYHQDEDNAMNLGDWLPVTASFSASLQNNHHHFPHFLRTSHAPDEYDFGFLTVRALKALGLVKPSRSGAQVPDGVLLENHGL